MGLSKGIGNVSVGVLFLLSVITLNYKDFLTNCFHFKHVWALSFMFLILILGLFYTSDLAEGVYVLKQNIRFLFIPLLLLMNVQLIKEYRNLLLFFFVIATSTGGLFTVILNYLNEPLVIKISEFTPFLQKYIQHHNRAMFGAYSPFYDRIQYANSLGIAVITGLYLISVQYKRLFVFLSLLILIYASIILGGRGGQLALLGALFTYFSVLMYRKWAHYLIEKLGKPLTLAVISFSILFLFLLTPLLVYKYNDNVKKRYSLMKWELETFYTGEPNKEALIHFTSVRRLVSWKNTWEIIRKNPVFGVGTGDYKAALTAVYKIDGYDFPENSHSQYLYFWAMLGIVGLSFFIGIIVYWVNHIKSGFKEYSYGLSFIIFYAIAMLPDAVLIQQMDNLTFSLLFSFIGIIGANSKK